MSNSATQKLIWSVMLFILNCSFAFAQLDTIHYFPPIHQAHGTANQGALYISTPSISPVPFTISNGAGTILASGTVSNTTHYTHQMNGVNTTILVPSSDLNNVLTNKGFIVRSASPVYANLRYEAVGQNQSFSITAKGRKGLGTSFRIAHAKADASATSNTVVSVMASANNTQVTFDLVGTNIILSGTTPPPTSAPITITLNKGESFCIASKNSTNGANRDNMIGRLITSNKPIAVVMGNYLGCFAPGNHDIGLDQPVPEELLGTEYAFLQGAGAAAKEKVIIIGNQAGTDVFINGSAVPFATLNAGDHVEIPGTNYTVDSVMFVRTSQPAYAWQMLFGKDSYANWGLNFVPPFSCLTERFVDFIPVIDSLGTQKFTGNLNIITYAGSSILVNGAVPPVAPVPIPGSNLVGYRLHSLTGSQNVYANTIAVVGFYGFNGASSFAGYFSGFDSIPAIITSIEDTICPDTLFVRNGFDAYQWLHNNSQIPLANDTFLSLNSLTGTFNVVVNKGACIDTSGTFTISCILPIELNYFEGNCLAKGKAQFQWQATSEIELKGYEVQGSEDGKYWNEIPIAQSYQNGFVFNSIVSLNADSKFFRIRMTDENGISSYSKQIQIVCDFENPKISVMPQNPDGSIDVYISGLGDNFEINICSMEGKQISSNKNLKENHVLIPGNLFSSGLYWISAKGNGNQCGSKFFVR